MLQQIHLLVVVVLQHSSPKYNHFHSPNEHFFFSCFCFLQTPQLNNKEDLIRELQQERRAAEAAAAAVAAIAKKKLDEQRLLVSDSIVLLKFSSISFFSLGGKE